MTPYLSLAMLFVLVTGGCALIGVHRLLVGPTYSDRLVGMDLLFAAALIFCLLAAWVSGRTLYLDVAIGLALAGFVATLAWARLIQRQSRGEPS